MESMESYRAALTRFFAEMWPAEEKPLVLGEGRCDHPPLMLVGEAPGQQETLQGRPFVGKAGKNLDVFLDAVGLARPGIYISNTVKVRPVKLSPKGSVSNRPPNREELAMFVPWLKREILLVAPSLLVTLGNVPLKALMGQGAVIGAMHGKLTRCDVGTEKTSRIFDLFPLYHPASIIYNRALMEVYNEDLQALRRELDRREAAHSDTPDN